MKKLIIAGAIVLTAAAANAQSNEKSQEKKPAATTIAPAPPAAIQATPQQDDDRRMSAAHWTAAKRQLESAKDHLQKAKFDPGNKRENAVKSIDAALEEINKAMTMINENPIKDSKGHDHSDPNHKH